MDFMSFMYHLVQYFIHRFIVSVSKLIMFNCISLHTHQAAALIYIYIWNALFFDKSLSEILDEISDSWTMQMPSGIIAKSIPHTLVSSYGWTCCKILRINGHRGRLDCLTVSLHSPYGRQIACHKGCVRGSQCPLKIDALQHIQNTLWW